MKVLIACDLLPTESVGPHYQGNVMDILNRAWPFGHPETKSTYLWLKNLPLLKPTNVVSLPKDKKNKNRIHYMSPSSDRSKLHSITYSGIIRAMAEQWSNVS